MLNILFTLLHFDTSAAEVNKKNGEKTWKLSKNVVYLRLQ